MWKKVEAMKDLLFHSPNYYPAWVAPLSIEFPRQEWAVISFSRGSCLPRNWTPVSCVSGIFFTVWATRQPTRVNEEDLLQQDMSKR